MERLHYTSFESPYGRLWIMRSEQGVVRLILPTPGRRKVDPGPSLLAGFRDRHLPGFQMMESMNRFRDVIRWLKSLFRGDPPAEEIPVDLFGTDFQKKVWEIVYRIPYGTTLTYGAISHRLGRRSSAARAVGAAVAANPVPLIVPCHRVIGDRDKLVGFGGGLKMKQGLLREEGILLL
jgi:methylated-DNA-[protein]-cysteine S-methyltransferase